jgi:hypothetical protein
VFRAHGLPCGTRGYCDQWPVSRAVARYVLSHLPVIQAHRAHNDTAAQQQEALEGFFLDFWRFGGEKGICARHHYLYTYCRPYAHGPLANAPGRHLVPCMSGRSTLLFDNEVGLLSLRTASQTMSRPVATNGRPASLLLASSLSLCPSLPTVRIRPPDPARRLRSTIPPHPDAPR